MKGHMHQCHVAAGSRRCYRRYSRCCRYGAPVGAGPPFAQSQRANHVPGTRQRAPSWGRTAAIRRLSSMASASLRTPPGIIFVVRSRIFFTTISGASVRPHSTSITSPCRRRVPRPGRHHVTLNGALVEAVLVQLSTVCLSVHPHTPTNIELLGQAFGSKQPRSHWAPAAFEQTIGATVLRQTWSRSACHPGASQPSRW